MKELNKENLKSALRKLPEYDAPDSVWSHINARLPLAELPTYDAPEFVWTQIESQLSDATQNAKPKPQTLKILRGGKAYKFAVAASVALLVTVGFWFFKINNTHRNNIRITTEVVDNQLLKHDFSGDDETFAMVEEFCKTSLPVCEQSDFKNLKAELDELNTAHTRLKNAIGDYAANPDLIDEITKIDNERTTVLRQLVEKIN